MKRAGRDGPGETGRREAWGGVLQSRVATRKQFQRPISGVWRVLACVAGIVLTLAAPGLTRSSSDGPASPRAIPAHRKAQRVAIIEITGEIDGSSRTRSVVAASVARRIELAERGGADAIVFEINSAGGAISGARDIASAIRASRVSNTVAWLRPEATGGAALVALACREIVVAKDATLGDVPPPAWDPIKGTRRASDQDLRKALPVLVGEVLESVRRHNADFANAYEWDEYLALAMISDDVELWEVEHVSSGQRMCVDRAELALILPGQGSAGPARLAAPLGTATPASTPLGLPAPSGVPVPVGSNKLLAASQGLASTIALLPPSKRPTIDASQVGRWKLVDKVTDGTSCAELRVADLIHYGFAANDVEVVKGQRQPVYVETDEDARAFFGASYLRRLDRSWSEGLVKFLTTFWVRGVLIAVFLIALFVEMTHPGVALPGVIAGAALVGLLAPPLLIGMANWWHVAAILSGILLLMMELFVLPGFGVAGIAGMALLFLGLVGSFTGSSGLFPTDERGRHELLWGLSTVVASLTTAGIAIYFLVRHLGSIPGLNRLVLKDPTQGDEDSLVAAMGEEDSPLAGVGDVGVAGTPLRPAGKVDVNGRVLDAVADHGFIPAGAKVRVTSVSGFKIGVEMVGGDGAAGTR